MIKIEELLLNGMISLKPSWISFRGILGQQVNDFQTIFNNCQRSQAVITSSITNIIDAKLRITGLKRISKYCKKK